MMNAEIRNFIVEQLLSGKLVADDENLLLSGLVDSLGVMRLVRFLENAFSITVPPQDVTITHFMTIDTIVSYVESRQLA